VAAGGTVAAGTVAAGAVAVCAWASRLQPGAPSVAAVARPNRRARLGGVADGNFIVIVLGGSRMAMPLRHLIA
jgi:hypothetical protein